MSVLHAFDRCRSPADFYQVRIGLENLATPEEMHALVAAAERLPEPVKPWLQGLGAMMAAGATDTQAYRRTALGPNVTLFASDEAGGARKCLIASFCGLYPYRPLAIPTPVFLQHVPARRYDVLVLRDPGQRFYIDGVAEFGDGIGGVAQRLRALARERDSAGLRTLGMSAGTLAALVAGTLASAQCAVGFSGEHPGAPRFETRLRESGLDTRALDRALDGAAADAATRTMLIFGADSAPDRDGAESIRRVFPRARVVEVAGISSHFVPYELLRRGALARLLDQAILDGFDPGPGPD